MRCTSPITVPTTPNPVPCGKCLACRIAHRDEWSMRAVHELHTTEGQSGLFVTLTYDNEHLPEYQTLVKKDLQDFMKRLRDRLDYRKIKYLAAGEYGDRNHRPHYHVLLYNVTYDDIPAVKSSWKWCDWDVLGDSAFGDITPESAAYVSGYIDKKYGGELGKEVYTNSGRIPPFRLVSRGFGRDYLDQYFESIYDNAFIIFRGRRKSIPRYYANRLKEKYGLDLNLKTQASAEEFETRLIQEVCELPEPIPSTLLRNNFRNYMDGLAYNESFKDIYFKYQDVMSKHREQCRIRYEAALKRRGYKRRHIPF